jgi:hypothetical protein
MYIDIDWQQCVLDLRRFFPIRKISVLTGIDKQTLGRLSRAEMAEPKFSQGVTLLDLHTDNCGAAMTRRLRGVDADR